MRGECLIKENLKLEQSFSQEYYVFRKCFLCTYSLAIFIQFLVPFFIVDNIISFLRFNWYSTFAKWSCFIVLILKYFRIYCWICTCHWNVYFTLFSKNICKNYYVLINYKVNIVSILFPLEKMSYHSVEQWNWELSSETEKSLLRFFVNNWK